MRQKGIWAGHKCVSLCAKSRQHIYKGKRGAAFKFYFIHLTYMLAKASTISHECIKQYDPVRATDKNHRLYEVVVFHLSSISKTIP